MSFLIFNPLVNENGQNDMIAVGCSLIISLALSMNFFLSLINVTFSAWVVPLMNSFFSNSTREVLLGLVLASAAGALAWFMLHAATGRSDGSPETAQPELP